MGGAGSQPPRPPAHPSAGPGGAGRHLTAPGAAPAPARGAEPPARPLPARGPGRRAAGGARAPTSPFVSGCSSSVRLGLATRVSLAGREAEVLQQQLLNRQWLPRLPPPPRTAPHRTPSRRAAPRSRGGRARTRTRGGRPLCTARAGGPAAPGDGDGGAGGCCKADATRSPPLTCLQQQQLLPCLRGAPERTWLRGRSPPRTASAASGGPHRRRPGPRLHCPHLRAR